MNQFLSEELWPTLTKIAAGASKRAAVAYVSSDTLIKFGSGDLLICDASDNAIKTGQTDATVLSRAFNRGAEIYSVPGLHAKVLLLDEKAIIGSANVSKSSAGTLIEGALLSDQPTIVSAAQAFIMDLKEKCRDNVLGRRELNELLKIPVFKRPSFHGTSTVDVVGSTESRTWVIATKELLNDPPESKREIDEMKDKCVTRMSNPGSYVEWLRWTGRSSFRKYGKRNDWVIQMWRLGGRKNPTCVYERMPIVERLDYENATYFFVEIFPKSESRTILWPKFKNLAMLAGVSRRIGADSTFEISNRKADSLDALWKDYRSKVQ